VRVIRVELAVHLSAKALALLDSFSCEKDANIRAELRKTIVARDRVVAALCPIEYGAFGAWCLCRMIVEDETRLDIRPSSRAS